MNKNTCCFIGHRKIKITNEQKNKLRNTIEKLITQNNVDTFLFGSKGEFDELCYEITSELKQYYSHIKRVYVRAQFPYISEEYKNYLLKIYEDTYYPDKILNAGRYSYVERNFEMINNSKFCIMYFDENYLPNKHTKSGTKTAYAYALKKEKTIINILN